jgi:2-keto-4-pentenoate hydratase/2-oxohepta-3-ene-1,7-dioic acid hydratase in catechol pathway
MGYKGPGTWYLQNGDHIECEIEGIGILANPVSTRKRRS